MSEQTAGPKHGDIRIWHNPQVPGPTFFVQCSSIVDAVWLTDVICQYDTFQFENRIKPDYASVGGIQVYDEQLAEDDEEGNGWADIEMDDCLRIIDAAANHMTILDPVLIMRGEA